MSQRVMIGIQARSSSKRFPNKIHEMLGNKTLLQHIIASASNAAEYINNWGTKKIMVEVAVLIPEGDPAKEKVPPGIKLIEGSEEDVLSRYALLVKEEYPDFVVRLTADCPLIPSFIISKLITIAVMNGYDYVSNVDERVRTTPDGFDCEVISARLLNYAAERATGIDREHVTTFIRKSPPPWIRWGTVVNFLDLSELMISVDTPADLERVRVQYDRVEKARRTAVSIFGARGVHKI